MEVMTLGDGDPAMTIVGCLHGDEPCGRAIIERLQDDPPELDQAVRCVVANERALEQDQRSIHTDLNRAFPGDRTAEGHEQRLAAELLDRIGDTPIIDLHAAHGIAEPFCVIASPDSRSRRMCRASGCDRVIDVGSESGGLIQHVPGISVECGLVGSQESIEDGHAIVERLLADAGCIDGDAEDVDPTVYRLEDPIERRDGMRFTGTNFQPVSAGAAYATVDGRPVRAEEDFVPLLAATDGYPDRLGYRGRRMGRLSEYKTMAGEGDDHA